MGADVTLRRLAEICAIDEPEGLPQLRDRPPKPLPWSAFRVNMPPRRLGSLPRGAPDRAAAGSLCECPGEAVHLVSCVAQSRSFASGSCRCAATKASAAASSGAIGMRSGAAPWPPGSRVDLHIARR